MFHLNISYKFIIISMLAAFQLNAIPAQVLIIRHGEKPSKGNELSGRGFERSGALTFYLQHDAFITDFGPPSVIFAAQPKSNKSSKRSIQTVTPYAELNNLAINSSFKSVDIQEIAKEILTNPDYEGKTVLVSWVHKYVNQLAAELRVEPMPPQYPGNRYDLVYKITYVNEQGEAPKFSVGLQKLMFDDQPTLPKRFLSSF